MRGLLPPKNEALGSRREAPVVASGMLKGVPMSRLGWVGEFVGDRWESLKWFLSDIFDDRVRPVAWRSLAWFMLPVELSTGRWLHAAVRLRWRWWVKRRLARGDSPVGRSLSGATPVDLAASRPSLDFAALLKSHSIRPGVLEETLAWACERRGLFVFAVRLLEVGASPRVASENEPSSLETVVDSDYEWGPAFGTTELVTSLIGRGQRFREARHFVKACRLCAPASMTALVGAGAHPWTINQEAKGLGLMALRYSNEECVDAARVLVASGASVSVEVDGARPIHKAAMHGHTAMVRFLLEHGAYPNSLDADGCTPLDLALSRACSPKRTIEALRASGAKTAVELTGERTESCEGTGANPRASTATIPESCDTSTRLHAAFVELGLGIEASPSEVRRRYRLLAKQHHPDGAAKRQEEADARQFQRVHEAYACLREHGRAE